MTDVCQIVIQFLLQGISFQYRVEVFFKEIVVDGPVGKTKYCAIGVEFQIRGSPHSHTVFCGWPMLQFNFKKQGRVCGLC